MRLYYNKKKSSTEYTVTCRLDTRKKECQNLQVFCILKNKG